MYFHNIMMSSKIKFLFTLLMGFFQTSAMLSPIHVFSVPIFNFQVNPTVEVYWPPKSNNDRT